MKEAAGTKTSLTGLMIAGVLMVATLAAYYVLFAAYDTHMSLYKLSKTFADYEIRQYLGMSKRYLPQYVHIVFLFALLVISKYVFVSNRGKGRFDRVLGVAVKYWIYVFLFHFPLLYFIAAHTDHDRTSDFDQAFLLITVVLVSAALGYPCMKLKPWFDRLQKRVLAQLRSADNTAAPRTGPPPLTVTSSHSRFIDIAKVVAAAAVVVGHFSFAEFVSWEIPFANGYAPRFAVPAFFIISGYLTMLSLDRTQDGFASALFKRYWALTYIIVPMLLLVPVLDHFGFAAKEELYRMHFRFVEKTTGGPETWLEFVTVFASSVIYLNEILLFKLLGWFSGSGGVIAFSNDAFWFMCYLLPFTALLCVMCKLHGLHKYVWLVVLALVFGPAIVMLSPLFFAGVVAYMIHRRF